MAIKILGNGVEVRKPGFSYTGEILAGQAVTLDGSDISGQTIKVAGASDIVLGLALETTVAPLTNWLNYDDYNRGGLVSAVSGSGFEVEVFDDGRGPIFDTAQSYAINDKIYCGADGVLTNQEGGQEIGFVTKAPATANDSMKIQINL
jgi:hypothetical protein